MEYEEFGERKVCPLRAGGKDYNLSCTGESCAWWCEFAQDCAVPLLAWMFADSDICKSIFDNGSSLI